MPLNFQLIIATYNLWVNDDYILFFGIDGGIDVLGVIATLLTFALVLITYEAYFIKNKIPFDDDADHFPSQHNVGYEAI